MQGRAQPQPPATAEVALRRQQHARITDCWLHGPPAKTKHQSVDAPVEHEGDAQQSVGDGLSSKPRLSVDATVIIPDWLSITTVVDASEGFSWHSQEMCEVWKRNSTLVGVLLLIIFEGVGVHGAGVGGRNAVGNLRRGLFTAFRLHFSFLVVVAVFSAAVRPTCGSSSARRSKMLAMSGSHNRHGRMRRRSIDAVFINYEVFFVFCPE